METVERSVPSEDTARGYDELFTLYCQLYPTLKPIMHRLSANHKSSE